MGEGGDDLSDSDDARERKEEMVTVTQELKSPHRDSYESVEADCWWARRCGKCAHNHDWEGALGRAHRIYIAIRGFR